MNKTRFNAPVTALIAFAIFMQSFAFAAFAQQKDSGNDSDAFYTEPVKEDLIDTVQSKIAPDLEEKANEAFHNMRSDAMERVIIQLKSATQLNESFGDLSEDVRSDMFAREVRSNRAESSILVTDIARARRQSEEIV